MLKNALIACLALPLLLGPGRAAPIGNAELRNSDKDAGNWLMYGRTYDDHRFSPLNQINEQTVGKLGLAWSHEFGSTRGLEATPLVKDGVLYTTGNWSVVYAIDAKTGRCPLDLRPEGVRARAPIYLLRRGEPRPRALSRQDLCRHLGRPADRAGRKYRQAGWDVSTADSANSPMPSPARRASPAARCSSATPAPNMACAAISPLSTPKPARWPGASIPCPAIPPKASNPKPWKPPPRPGTGEWWKTGGGGTAWEGIVYDPALDLVYFGTGNPTAWYRSLRGGNGDNLYTASILAVRASTGELAWHFQTTPGDNWDFDSTQPLVQADLNIGGRTRKVIMQANKNGFFYVLDRATGEFISGKPFVSGITWATGLDPKTGRPIELPAASARPRSSRPRPMARTTGIPWPTVPPPD